MPTIVEILENDSFGLATLTEQLIAVDPVPGLAGQLAFDGVRQGIPTIHAYIESRAETLGLVSTSRRGGRAEQADTAKANLRAVAIPHVQIEQTIEIASLQDVRAFGTTDAFAGAAQVVAQQQQLMGQRLDLTLESLRLGALRGIILDADGSVIENLFTLFGVVPEDAVDLQDALVTTPAAYPGVRAIAQQIARKMIRNAKLPMPSGWRIHALTGDNLFDRLVECDSVQKAYSGYDRAEKIMGTNYAFGAFEFGGIIWHNYQGTDDNTTVAVDPDDAQMFPVGIPGLFREFYAPADFGDTINTVGLPRYSRMARDPEFDRWVKLHAQMNPLPICTRPKLLMRATIATA
jgi:hypothetical protein